MELAVGHFWVQLRGDDNFLIGWYFDTPFEDFEGPFETLAEAKKAFTLFCEKELGLKPGTEV